MAIYTIAITGASGAPYGMRVLQTLIEGGNNVYLTITGDGLSIMNDETGLLLKGSAHLPHSAWAPGLRFFRA